MIGHPRCVEPAGVSSRRAAAAGRILRAALAMAVCSCAEPSGPPNAPVAGATYLLLSADGLTLPYRTQSCSYCSLLPDTVEDSRVAVHYLVSGRLEFDRESLAVRRLDVDIRCRNAATGEPLPCDGPASAAVTARLRYTVHPFRIISLQDTAPCGFECIQPVQIGVLDGDELVITDHGHTWRWRRSDRVLL